MPRSSSCAVRLVLACVLVAVGSSTWGSDPIHKCRGADGQSHYQSTPCAPAQRTEWVRDYPDDPPMPAVAASSTAPVRAQARAHPPSRAPAGSRRPKASAQGAVISMHRDPAACERAKQARDQAYARLGLKRDFATSRKLDDRVNDACR